MALLVGNLLGLLVGLITGMMTGFFFERRASRMTRELAQAQEAQIEFLKLQLSKTTEAVYTGGGVTNHHIAASVSETVDDQVLAAIRSLQDASGSVAQVVLRSTMIREGHLPRDVDAAIGRLREAQQICLAEGMLELA